MSARQTLLIPKFTRADDLNVGWAYEVKPRALSVVKVSDMVSGVILVTLLVLAITIGLIAIIRLLIQVIEEWWSKPIEPAFQLPLPSVNGPECLVLAFADMFVETVKSPPEHLEANFTKVPSSNTHVSNKRVVEEMLFSVFAWLSLEGVVEWKLCKRQVDPLSPFPPRDWELHMRPIRAFPRTPFARNFEVGFRRALKAWFIHKPGDDSASVEEVIEFALREIRKLMGRAALTGDVYRDLVRYVQRFLATQGLYEMREGVGFLGRRFISFEPIRERVEELRQHAEQFKVQLEQFVRDEPALADQLRVSISEGLSAIRQLEPDRDSLF